MNFAELKRERECIERGDRCDRQGLYEEALRAYDDALGIVPGDADVLFDKGETLVKMGRGDEAGVYFAQAVSLYVGA